MNPTPGRRPDWVDDDLLPFRSTFERIAGCDVHVLDEGDGPVLLMLHGNPTWSFLYRDLVRLLSPRFRCVAPDYPGMGLSTARPGYRYGPEEHREVIVELVEHLDLTDVTLIGQDWGGPIGMGAAVRAPHRYSRLVLGNTWFWDFTDLRSRAFSAVMGGWLGTVAHRRLNTFVERVIPFGHTRRPVSDREMAMWRGPYPTPASREPTHVFPERVMGAAPYLADVAYRVRATGLEARPTLVLHGTADPAFPAAVMDEVAARLPNHTRVDLDGASHYWQDDAPEMAAEAIASWFDTVGT